MVYDQLASAIEDHQPSLSYNINQPTNQVAQQTNTSAEPTLPSL